MINKKLKSNRIILFVSIILTMYLSSCIQYDETLSLNSDGSGIWNIKIEAPQSSPSADWTKNNGFLGNSGLIEVINNAEGVNIVSSKSWLAGDGAIQEISLSFSSIDALYADNLKELHSLIGYISFLKNADDLYEFKREINLDSADGDLGIDPYFRRMFGNLYKSVNWNYSLNLPGSPIDSLSNGSVSKTGNSISWTFPLESMLSSKIEMNAICNQRGVSDILKTHIVKVIIIIACLIIMLIAFFQIRAFLIGRDEKKKQKKEAKNLEKS